jgi:hypothetical protein
MLPPTTTRVSDHTSDRVNREIWEKTEENVKEYSERGTFAIDKRLEELDHEWDIERTLEANAAALALIGLGLGTFVNKKFYVLPAVVTGFLLQHALQGWCPPVPFFRRRGIRTMEEIQAERYALKALRGDYEPVYAKGAREKPDVDRVMHATIA